MWWWKWKNNFYKENRRKPFFPTKKTQGEKWITLDHDQYIHGYDIKLDTVIRQKAVDGDQRLNENVLSYEKWFENLTCVFQSNR